MNHNAIYALYPNVASIDDDAGAFDKDGNKINIDMALVNAWQNPEAYKYKRQTEYPLIADQLDMLWHMMDDETIPGKNSTWYNTIKEVKDNNPK